MNVDQKSRGGLRLSRRWIVAFLLFALSFVIAAAGWRLYVEVSLLRSAPRDNVQWTSSQLEVDTSRLRFAVAQARTSGGSLENVRRRFDILYSRIQVLTKARTLQQLRETPDGREPVLALELFLAEVTPLIDGPDADLTAALGQIEERIADLSETSRTFAVEAVQYFSQVSDEERERLVQVLRLTAAAGVLLICILVVLLIYITRQNEIVAERSLEIERSGNLLKAINEAAIDAIIVADMNGVILGWNGSAGKIFGYSQEEAIGSSLANTIIPEQYREQHLDGLKRIAKEGTKRFVDAGRLELSALRADGSEIPIEMAIAASSNNKSPIFIAYLRDISARKAAQQQLLEARDAALTADKAKSEFLAVMSHEMRTPLNGVLGVLELLQGTSLNAKQRNYVETAVFSGEVMLRHINDVLDISRIDAGKMTYANEQVDLSEIVDQVLEIARPGVEANGNKIAKSIGPGLTGFLGDGHRIRQVLLNLVGNAGKFTHDGRILVSIALLGGSEESVEIEFAVTDSGIGLPEHQRNYVFDDFITFDSLFNRSNAGTGLGLAICRRIVNGMGGVIGVTDGFEGGSRFWFRLTLARSKFAMGLGNSESETQALTPAKRILIVEDNEINRMVVSEILESLGHEVFEASNGHEGIVAAQDEHFDLIFMDISMPGIDGIETTKRIRSGSGPNSDTPIVGLTAHVMPEVRDAVIAAGMQTCLSKPVRRNELQQVIADHDFGPAAAADQNGQDNLAADWETDLIDEEILADLAASLPPALLSETIGKIVDQLESLRGLLADIDVIESPDHLAADVHKVAGAAALVGAAQLHELLSDLEYQLRHELVSDLKAKVDSIIDCVDQTRLS